MVLLGLYKGLLVLLYFGSVMIMLTANPNVEACGLDSVFAAHHRSRLICVALRHWKSHRSAATLSPTQREELRDT